MDVQAIARWATGSERRIDMADMRKCIGSAKFGIEAHEAPVGDFPAQPSQRDGLGRMCRPHWSQYTTALRKAALARQAADGGAASVVGSTESDPAAVAARDGVGRRRAKAAGAAKPEPIRTRPARGRKTDGEPIVKAEPSDAANVEEASVG
jgi:hypothetical protein